MGARLYNQNCKRCAALYPKAKNVCIGGNGDLRARVMIIGEAPGEKEDEVGAPFVGPAGDRLNQAIASAGAKRDDLFVTNIAKCHPPDNRNPKIVEIYRCATYLRREAAAIEPRLVLVLGGVALKALFGLTSVGSNRGRWLEAEWGDWGPTFFLPTWHPTNRGRGSIDHDIATFVAVWQRSQRLKYNPVRTRRVMSRWGVVVKTELKPVFLC